MMGIPIYPFGNFLIAVDCFFSTYAILNYRVIDVKIAIARAFIFTFLYTLIFSIPFLLRKNYNLWLYSTGLTVFLASISPFIFVYLRQFAEGIILKKQRLYQNALRELTLKMTHIRDLGELLNTISSTITTTAEISLVAIYLKESQYNAYRLMSANPKESYTFLERLIPVEIPALSILIKNKKPLLSEEIESLAVPSGIIVPFINNNELMGFMIMGKKLNNKAYTPDDVLVFENLSYSASLAIENCRFWQEIADRQRKERLQEMDTYSYSLAHEIDNPMQVILGQGWLLKSEVLRKITDEKERNDVEGSFDFIMDAAKRVSGMVKAIRDFGQPTTGEFKPIKIEDVTDSFEKLYFPQFKTNIVLFEKINALESPVLVNCEKPALMQVLVILANNALHAMKKTRERRITMKMEAVNHEWIRISLSDNGYGIKQELLSVIFTPFTTTKASTEGSGMGLYNAKMIVEHHKGRIWAESEGEGKGATFVIELPVHNSIAQPETEQDHRRIY